MKPIILIKDNEGIKVKNDEELGLVFISKDKEIITILINVSDDVADIIYNWEIGESTKQIKKIIDGVLKTKEEWWNKIPIYKKLFFHI